jgi:ABC-type nitrate/sulfonate/bicarbonate transport system permease component
VTLPHSRPSPNRLVRAALTAAWAAAYVSAIVVIWQLAIVIFSIPNWLIASPAQVLQSLVRLPSFYFEHAGYTAAAAGCGLIAAIIVGIIVGVALSASTRLGKIFTPLLLAVNTFPIVAIAPLLTVTLGYGIISKIAVAFLLSWMPIVFNTAHGFTSTPAEFQTLASISAMSRPQRLWYIQLPFALPYITAGFKIAAPAAVLGAVVGEFAGSQGTGLGTVILGAGSDIGVDRVYASLVLLAAMGGAFFLIVAKIDKWVHDFLSVNAPVSSIN